MSIDKSLKHLKFKDEFLIANVSNYLEKHSDGTSHHIQATQVIRKTFFQVRKEL